MIIYNDILGKLKEAGYDTCTIRRDSLLGQSTLTRLRKNEPVSTDTIDVVCKLTGLQPGDLLMYVEE